MIKKIGIVSKNKKVIPGYKKELRKQGFKYALKKADIILCIGGDGTLLEAERRFPGIPKLPVKDSRMCDKCEINLFDNFLDLIIEEKYYIESINKLECYFNGKKTLFLATNDIIIRNVF